MNEITESRITEINKLQGEISSITKQVFEIGSKAIANAQRIGELLLEQQTEMQKSQGGNFSEWIDNNCTFKHGTGYRYIDLYKYRDRINSNGSFVIAYQQIDQIKEEERRLIEDKAQERVKEYRETGVKPDGWRKHTDDNLLKKQIEEESSQGAFDIFEAGTNENSDTEGNSPQWGISQEEEKSEGRKRFEELQQRQRAEEERQREKALDDKINKMFEEKREEKKQADKRFEEAKKALNDMTDTFQKIQEWKQKFRMSDGTMEGGFMNALLQYLGELPNDNERLSFCSDVIKVCKSIAVELHEKITKESV